LNIDARGVKRSENQISNEIAFSLARSPRDLSLPQTSKLKKQPARLRGRAPRRGRPEARGRLQEVCHDRQGAAPRRGERGRGGGGGRGRAAAAVRRRRRRRRGGGGLDKLFSPLFFFVSAIVFAVRRRGRGRGDVLPFCRCFGGRCGQGRERGRRRRRRRRSRKRR